MGRSNRMCGGGEPTDGGRPEAVRRRAGAEWQGDRNFWSSRHREVSDMGVRGRALVIAGTAAGVILVIVAIVVWPGRGQAQTSQTPRLPGTPHPNLSGVWQALNEANWDLEGHAARTARVLHPGVP